MFQSGYYAMGIHATPYYMRGAPDVVHPPGTRPGQANALILRDDDEVLWTLIMAFLHIKDDE